MPSHADGGASSTAEAGTLHLEMKYLSHLTGNDTYWRKAERAMKVLSDNHARDGLVPIFVHPESGRFTSQEIRLGSRGDSYYGLNSHDSTILPSRKRLLTYRRIPCQTIPADLRTGACVFRNVGRGVGGNLKALYHYY